MGKVDIHFGRVLKSIVQDPKSWDTFENKLLDQGIPAETAKRVRNYLEETNRAHVKSYFRAVKADGESDDQNQDQTDSAPLSNLKKVK